MRKSIQPQLFSRGRIVGVRFSAEEHQRLIDANAKRTKEFSPMFSGGHVASLSSFIRSTLGPIINPPRPAGPKAIGTKRSTKKAGKKK